MKAHRRHLYQYLANEMSMPHWAISSAYAVVQFSIGLLAIAAYKGGVVWQLALVVFTAIVFITVYQHIKELRPRAEAFKVVQNPLQDQRQ